MSLYEQDWHDSVRALRLDKLGNWDAVRLDPDGDDTAQTMTTTSRGHNDANKYTSLGGTAAYDHPQTRQIRRQREDRAGRGLHGGLRRGHAGGLQAGQRRRGRRAGRSDSAPDCRGPDAVRRSGV